MFAKSELGFPKHCKDERIWASAFLESFQFDKDGRRIWEPNSNSVMSVDPGY